jgi:glycerol-3-phosphate dehydrogenase
MIRFTEKYDGSTFDVLIIGGGITGASVAYEAASRGLKVALVEKNDFASATSSASSRMIHGGLRYLANAEFALVRESLRERRIMMNIAPNFVHPMPFLFAMYKHDKNSPFVYKIGMILYDILSYDKNFLWDKSKKMPNHKFLSKSEVLKLIPNAKEEGLLGGNLYFDCTNHSPERMTLAFIKSAVKYGAMVANYAEMKKFIFYKSEKKLKSVKAVEVFDKISGKTLQINCRAVVNCAGPWADFVLKKAENKNDHEFNLRRSEGIHFVTKKLNENYIFASINSKNKHYFIIPYRNYSLVGTTDKEYKGNPDNYRVTKQSLLELIDTVNSSFSDKEKITLNDIKFTYGGLRPLVEKQTEDVYNSSRKYEITDERKNGIWGLITVEGGKFTTSRSLAEKLVDKLARMLKIKIKHSVSKKIFLNGSEISNIDEFVAEKQKLYSNFDKNQIRFLVYSYGTEIDKLMSLFYQNTDLQTIVNEDGENLAQVVYAIRYEMALNLTDILMRRTGIGLLGQPEKTILQKIVYISAKELNWNNETIQNQINMTRKYFELPN